MLTGGLHFGESVPMRVTVNEAMPEQAPAQNVSQEGSPSAQPSPGEAKCTIPQNDPRLVTAARELRDRSLEQVNGHDPTASPLIGHGKYDVTRAVDPG